MLGLWKLHVFGGEGAVGLSVKAAYEIAGVVKKGRGVKILVKVTIFDCTESFRENAERTVLGIVKDQMKELVRGVDDILDIVLVED